jgi:hypothetical protein
MELIDGPLDEPDTTIVLEALEPPVAVCTYTDTEPVGVPDGTTTTIWLLPHDVTESATAITPFSVNPT